MKDLKVKAWDTINNRWYTGTSEFLWLDSKIFELKQDELIFCVYTGLKDNNNVDIYEGDILKDGTGIRQVIWDNDWARFISIPHRKEGIPMYVTIIGNIYENPELCKILK